jgi:hypothetical protein
MPPWKISTEERLFNATPEEPLSMWKSGALAPRELFRKTLGFSP